MGDVVELNAPALHAPDKVWFELHREKDACDVLVEMDDNTIYTAMFVTLDYLKRQMDLHYQMTQQLEDTPQVRYCLMDTPHILVDDLTHDILEDTIDNLIALDTFESHFTRITENHDETIKTTRTTKGGELATQEVAAVVISDVLVVEE
jgi:hypothetical protein